VAIATWFINYCIETRPGSTPAFAAKLLAGAQAGFTVGRFSGTFLMHYIKPRKVFLVYLAMVVVFLAASCGARGNAGVSMLYLTLFFESICFPTIVALGIRGLGRHYKRGSGFIVGGVIGGGCVPALTGKVADIYNNTGIAMVVPMAFMVAALTYPICVNFLPRYKIPADALGSSAIGTSGNDLEKNDADVDDEAQVAKTREGAQVMEIEKR
jgi:FHS family L-fucose permease-like MFS transporter